MNARPQPDPGGVTAMADFLNALMWSAIIFGGVACAIYVSWIAAELRGVDDDLNQRWGG